MNEQSEEQKPETACGPGCNCGGSNTGRRGRWIAGIAILAIAGALVVRAVVKDKAPPAAPTGDGFAVLPVPAPARAPSPEAVPAATNAVVEIASLSDLNRLAMENTGVFVYVPGKGTTADQAPVAQMRGAVHTVEPQLRGGKIGLFVLKAGSPDHEQVAGQMVVPAVLAMVKGGGMSAASGEITETKLVQALVAASSSGGCGTGGCGPKGCN